MKRSEIVNLILKELETWQNCELNIKTAKKIVKICEKAGMMPPAKNGEIEVIDEGDSVRIPIWTWEKE